MSHRVDCPTIPVPRETLERVRGALSRTTSMRYPLPEATAEAVFAALADLDRLLKEEP